MKYIIAIAFFLILWFYVFPWYAAYLRGIEIDNCHQLKPPYEETAIIKCKKLGVDL